MKQEEVTLPGLSIREIYKKMEKANINLATEYKKLQVENKLMKNALDEIRSGGLFYGQWQDIANEVLKQIDKE